MYNDNNSNCHLQLNFCGLTKNLNYELFRCKECPVEIEIECAGNKETITGKICNIGIGYVNVKQDDCTVITIMQDRICRINWTDPCCNPCVIPLDCHHDNHCNNECDS